MKTLTIKRQWNTLYLYQADGKPAAAIRGGLLDAHREILNADETVAFHGWTETQKGGIRRFLLTDGEKNTLLASFLPPESPRCPLPPALREIKAHSDEGDYWFHRQKDRSVQVVDGSGKLLCGISPFFVPGHQTLQLEDSVSPVLAAGFYLFSFWMVRENQVEIV